MDEFINLMFKDKVINKETLLSTINNNKYTKEFLDEFIAMYDLKQLYIIKKKIEIKIKLDKEKAGRKGLNNER